MKKTFFSKKAIFAFTLMSSASFVLAGDPGAGIAGIESATAAIEDYVEPVGNLIQIIGAVVGIVGGIRIYNKWSAGDRDINKDLVSWGGACIFLLLVPSIISAFFGL